MSFLSPAPRVLQVAPTSHGSCPRSMLGNIEGQPNHGRSRPAPSHRANGSGSDSPRRWARGAGPRDEWSWAEAWLLHTIRTTNGWHPTRTADAALRLDQSIGLIAVRVPAQDARSIGGKNDWVRDRPCLPGDERSRPLRRQWAWINDKTATRWSWLARLSLVDVPATYPQCGDLHGPLTHGRLGVR
jgi:hypothetical protein